MTAGRPARSPSSDWRDEVIYQLLVDRFGNGDLSTTTTGVRPGELGRYQGGDWQGVIDHLDYLESSASPRCGSRRWCATSRPTPASTATTATGTQDFDAAEPALRRSRQAARAGASGARAQHEGHPRHRHQPRRAALLLRHQRQRSARRDRVRRGLRRAAADGLAGLSAARGDHPPHRVRSRLRPARRAAATPRSASPARRRSRWIYDPAHRSSAAAARGQRRHARRGAASRTSTGITGADASRTTAISIRFATAISPAA